MSVDGGGSPSGVNRLKLGVILGGIVLAVIMLFVGGFIFDTLKEGSESGGSGSAGRVVNNEQVKPQMVSMLEASINRVLTEGGEMNYFVNGENKELSVYNPNGVSGSRAASYMVTESGGSYAVLPDEQNFTSSMMGEFIPRMDDTFTSWLWDGGKGYKDGYFIGDVGVECTPPAIGVAPNLNMCKKVIDSGVIVSVEDGVIVQVDDKVNSESKTVRTVAYGVSQVVTGVLSEASAG